ncbi:MAG TPA: hypothetical protein VKR57_00475 [Terriglobales bacterium]|jgi:hypothetical protein|nr:hypothetical protein [Terriglobales bacterium]
MKSLIAAILLLCATGVAQVPNPTLKMYKLVEGKQENFTFSTTLSLKLGDWVEIKVYCENTLPSCVQPAYFNNGQEIKFPNLYTGNQGELVQQVFGLAAPANGPIKVLIPSIRYGIEYKGTIEVTTAQ